MYMKYKVGPSLNYIRPSLKLHRTLFLSAQALSRTCGGGVSEKEKKAEERARDSQLRTWPIG